MSTLLLAFFLALAPDKLAKPAPAPSPAPAKTTTPAAAPSLTEVVSRMQKAYEAASDYRARFSQKLTIAATGRERLLSGEVLIKKPGRMLWSYEKPAPQMYLTTGQVLWVYEPEDKQAYRQDLKASQLPAAVSFLMGKGRLTDEFEITEAKNLPHVTPNDYRLSLKPKKPQSTYKEIYFIVDPQTYLVTQSVLINAQGDVNAITFTDVKLNTKIKDKTFEFTPPKGVRIIEGPKQ